MVDSRPAATRPGEPTANVLIESFDRPAARQVLERHQFTTLHDVREKLQACEKDYGDRRPRGSFGNLTSIEFATMRSGQASGGTS